MKNYIVLCLVLVSCRPEHLMKSYDSKCNTPCYPDGYRWAKVGQCTPGIYQCDSSDSEPVCIGVGEPSEEVCDNIDNNCDGMVDAFYGDCSTECETGRRVCKSGDWGDCSARRPSPEICNGIDDNCNNVIDESSELPIIPCYSGLGGLQSEDLKHGTCNPGTYHCEYGANVCRNDKLPRTEACDGEDNDCNGKIDDNPACVTRPVQFKAVLTWSWPDNDVDLHVRHPLAPDTSHSPAGWYASAAPLDCYYANRDPSWDSTSDTADDPHLDRDDTVGVGPETTTINKIVVSNAYTVGVHAFNLRSSYPTATIKIYCGLNLVATRSYTFINNKDFWVVGTVQYSAISDCTFTPDDLVFRL